MGKNILVVRGGGRPRGNAAQLAESFAKGDFALVNYIGFNNKGTLLAGGCGDTNGRPCIEKTPHLQRAYEFGKNIYGACDGQ